MRLVETCERRAQELEGDADLDLHSGPNFESVNDRGPASHAQVATLPWPRKTSNTAEHIPERTKPYLRQCFVSACLRCEDQCNRVLPPGGTSHKTFP